MGLPFLSNEAHSIHSFSAFFGKKTGKRPGKGKETVGKKQENDREKGRKTAKKSLEIGGTKRSEYGRTRVRKTDFLVVIDGFF